MILLVNKNIKNQFIYVIFTNLVTLNTLLITFLSGARFVCTAFYLKSFVQIIYCLKENFLRIFVLSIETVILLNIYVPLTLNVTENAFCYNFFIVLKQDPACL